MPKVGFYAVRVGRKTGVYNSWEECKNQTEGYPHARYKRFNDMKAAEHFVSSTPLMLYSGTRGPSEAIKGKKRPHAKIEDESCWDVVYSDGACKGNGKIGSVAGVGVWWGHGDPRNIAERCPGDQTNNRAELIAILRVLETTPLSKRPLLIKTDSEYSINCFDKWLRSWMRNDWKTASGKPVKNEGIIRCINSHLEIRSRSGQKVRLQHVKGHSGEVGNEGADYLANEGTLKPPIQEHDWKALEARLVEELDSIDSNTASNAWVGQGSIDTADSIPLGPHAKSRNLGEAGVPSHHQLDRASTITTTSDLESNSSVCSLVATRTPSPYNEPLAKFRSGVAEQERSGRFDKLSSTSSKFRSPATPTKLRTDEMEYQVSFNVPRLTENAKKTAVPVLESACMERTGSVSPLSANVSPKQSVRLSDVFAEADLSLHAHRSTPQFLEGPSRPTPHDFYADSSTQSPVKVLYAAPPLVPVPVEDVNFEDYADCLVDDADLALELSD